MRASGQGLQPQVCEKASSPHPTAELRAPRLSSACGISPPTGQDSGSPIRTTHLSGQVRGSFVHVKDSEVSVSIFLGIPIIKTPVGSLRFALPEAPELWSVVRDGSSETLSQGTVPPTIGRYSYLNEGNRDNLP